MKKSIVMLICTFAAGICVAAVGQTEKALASKMRSYGGDIIDRRQAKGSFYVVSAQEAADIPLVEAAVREATADIKIDAIVTNGTFNLEAPALAGDATLFIVDDNRYPMSLVAVEAKWAVVNVAKLKSDKPAFFAARVKKEVFRTIGLLFGAFSNQYDTNAYSGVFSAEDLDQIAKVITPFEYRMRYEKYIPTMGFTPYKVVHYKKAVQEGWAPTPTNEYQQAIWDKVHAIPTNPIKIEFDPKKGR